MRARPWQRANHSRHVIGLQPIDAAWEREIGAELRRLYPDHVDEIRSIRRIDESGSSLNFRVECAARPTLLFKVHQRIQDPAVLSVLLAVQRHLHASDLLAGSPDRDALLPLSSVDPLPRGCPLVSARGGRPALLGAYRFVEGAHYHGGDDGELASVAFEFGRLQRALVTLPPSIDLAVIRRDRKVAAPLGDAAATWAALRARALAAGERAAAGVLAEHDALVAGAVAAAQPIAEPPPIAPGAATYADLHPHNTLVRDGRCVLVYDMESCAREPTQEPSLAFAVHRFSREWLAADPRRRVADGVTLFLDEYRRGGGHVDPGFRARLPAYIRATSLRKLFYMAQLLLEHAAPPAVETMRLAELHKFLGHLCEVDAYGSG